MKRAMTLACGVLAIGLTTGRLAPANAASADAGTSAAAATTALPSDPKGLAAFVTDALRAHDQSALERLVNWDGVRPIRRRLTLLQMSTSFGRPIKEAVVEDFPADGLAEAQARGTMKPNMPVLKTLRVVFDETPDEDGVQPANVFLIGEKDGAFRIAVMNSSGQQRK